MHVHRQQGRCKTSSAESIAVHLEASIASRKKLNKHFLGDAHSQNLLPRTNDSCVHSSCSRFGICQNRHVFKVAIGTCNKWESALTCSTSGALMTTLANRLFLFLVMYWNNVT